MDNTRYASLFEAAKVASTRCDNWRFAMSDELYDSAGLQGMAQMHDEENPADEDSFYIDILVYYAAFGIIELNIRKHAFSIQSQAHVVGLAHFYFKRHFYDFSNIANIHRKGSFKYFVRQQHLITYKSN
ncbi:MAG: hypothetical protein ACOYEH_09045 [Caldicoprobacterales bacterium]